MTGAEPFERIVDYREILIEQLQLGNHTKLSRIRARQIFVSPELFGRVEKPDRIQKCSREVIRFGYRITFIGIF